MSVKGEKYKSKASMKRHEKSEKGMEFFKEYGKKKVAKKPAKKAVGRKK